MSSPYNTSRTDPILLLADAMGPGGSEASILRMEAQGQREIVNSQVIPTGGASDEELTALGFTLGDVVNGDPLFRYATLPDGWRKVGTDHSMHSSIVDELDRQRLGIFYKAAFYDRRADMHVTSVFSYVSTCLYEGTTPVLDDVWATREAVLEAIQQNKDRSAESLPHWEKQDDEYATKRTAELRAEIARCDEYEAALASQSEQSSGGAADA